VANYVETLLINEGPSAFNTHTFLRSDGVTGELVNQPLVSASELTPPMGTTACMSIWEIWYQISGFTLQFSWKTLTGVDPVWIITPGVDSRSKFHRFGGLIDTSGMYAQGQLLMNTQGFNATTCQASFVLRMRKHDVAPPNYKQVGIPQGILPGVTYSGI